MEQGPAISITRPSENAPGNMSTGVCGPRDHIYLLSDRNDEPNTPGRKQWPQCVRGFTPTLLSKSEAIKEMLELERNLSKQTNVQVLARLADQSLTELTLNGQNLSDFHTLSKKSEFIACFINRFIIGPSVSKTPRDKKRLRISGANFRWLLTILEASPSFVSSILNEEIPVGFGSRQFADSRGRPIYTCWYTVHLRTASSCLDEEGNHALSAANSAQWDSRGYIHLDDIGNDIRPSKIGVYCRYSSKSCRMICVDFQDGRLHELAEEPRKRVYEAIESSEAVGNDRDQLDVHAVLLSSCAGWWSTTLSQLKRQMIHFETTLLEDSIQRVESSGPDLEATTRHLSQKKTIHAIMSHLQRYKTELELTKQITLDLQAAGPSIRNIQNENSTQEAAQEPLINMHLVMLIKRISALETFANELEKNIITILQLLFQTMKWRNDMTLVNNGTLVGKLLASTRTQTKASQGMMRESQKMSRDMRKDSVSMKTIALLTMFFLPATSFAAILSMPFFSQQEWLDHPKRAWLWVVLTIPTTILSALVYMHLTGKELKLYRRKIQDNEETELESLDIILEE